MTLLGAFLDAIGAVAPGAVPASGLRFPLRDADQGQLQSWSVAAGTDVLALDLEATAAAPAIEVLPLFSGWLTFSADDPDPTKAVPDPAAPAFDWADVDQWPTQGRIMVDLDKPAVERRLPALPVVPTRAFYWPVVLPPGWLTEASLKALAERRSVPRTGRSAIPRGSAQWPQHVLAAFLAGRHRLRIPEPPDDAGRASFVFPTVPLSARNGTLRMALARPVTTLDDKAPVVSALDPADPDHPLNLPVPARRVLQALRADLNVAGMVADAVTAAWPLGPRWFTLALGTPGEPATPPYSLGAFAGQTLRIDAGPARPIPLHGQVAIAQAPPAAAEPSVSVDFPPGPLTVQRTNVADPADSARLAIDFAAEPAPWAALMPERAALADRCDAITDSRRTRDAVTANLIAYAAGLRPAGWNANPRAGAAFDEIFHGSRAPWSTIRRREFARLFDALDLITFTNPAAPVTTLRPPHALLLWLMEGMQAERSANLFRGGWLTFADLGLAPLVRFTAAERAAATDAQIRTTARVALFWNFYGLDINNSQVGKGPDNLPFLGSPIADTISRHDAAWRAAHDAIVTAGVQPPPRADVSATISVRQNPAGSGVWQFRLGAGFGAAMLACQYGEYLRRLLALPAAAQQYASFGYAAYNRNPTAVSTVFTDAVNEIAGDPVRWAGKTPEHVLRSRPVATTDVSRGSPPPPRERSTNTRVQATHVAALMDAWARHLPGAW